MTTSEAQVAARALYDSLMSSTLQSLRAVAAKADQLRGEGAAQKLAAVMPPDAPRQVQNLVLALINEGRADQIPTLVRAFERYAEATGQSALSGEVVSAVELTAAQRGRITEDLRAKYGERLDLRFKVDPSIIGGLIIRVGDQVLDNSLRTRLSAIQRNMLAS